MMRITFSCPSVTHYLPKDKNLVNKVRQFIKHLFDALLTISLTTLAAKTWGICLVTGAIYGATFTLSKYILSVFIKKRSAQAEISLLAISTLIACRLTTLTHACLSLPNAILITGSSLSYVLAIGIVLGKCKSYPLNKSS